MYVSSPRRRRVPNPIRIRRHANSPLLAGRSPAPWTPDHPVPPTPSTVAASDSADTPTFPVSPSSATVSTCKTLWDTVLKHTPDESFSETADRGWGTDQDWGNKSPYPSTEDSPASTYWGVAELERTKDSPGAVTPGTSVSPRTVGIPRTPASTPVVGRAGSAIAVGRRGGVSKLRRIMYSPGLPVSPPLRWWKGEVYRPSPRPQPRLHHGFAEIQTPIEASFHYISSQTMTDLHTRHFSHIGGNSTELLDRLAVSELCKGWPVYRDASEWANYRSLFTKDAYVWTTDAIWHVTAWSGAQPIDDFIRMSIAGKSSGASIMHRECGTLVELKPDTGRAVGKMKATITQRFKHHDGYEYDVDCDCRFLFFYEKTKGERGDGIERDEKHWKAAYVKLIYEKDKIVPVDGARAPVFADEVLARYPAGYRYLGAAQSTLGYEIGAKLITGEDERACSKMYQSMERWLEGEDGPVGLFET
ncbi:catabolic 3-dehydroquinase [Colletotrichum cuscutae]|uniref:Catabolic 3-dehydroquinase n=1 Tax=Colletotrichum cuscutae TaxID=1209917 RepID=A0AAI9UFN0_9PEZI|nr:catabolic 3-dehydroquinase [Colletotrichum cuscutae]